jgi:hypothetical protein
MTEAAQLAASFISQSTAARKKECDAKAGGGKKRDPYHRNFRLRL